MQLPASQQLHAGRRPQHTSPPLRSHAPLPRPAAAARPSQQQRQQRRVSSQIRQDSPLSTEPRGPGDASSSAQGAPVSMTRMVLEQVDRQQAAAAGAGQAAGGAGGRTTYGAFKAADEQWSKLRTAAETGPAPVFVRQSDQALGPGLQAEVDVVVCGGTLGILVATALQARKLRVAVVERGALRGRDQEWNISKKEVLELVEAGLLTKQEVEACISVEFNPVRIGFHGGADVWTRDVLNIGVSPRALIDKVRARFEALGGIVYENVLLQGVTVHPDGTCLELQGAGPSPPPSRLVARLVMDCMGHASPIVKQLRWGRKPDGVCAVVGTLGSGFPPEANTTGDVIATMDDLSLDKSLQYYWEAFPAGSGPSDRTTYMFTYLDAEPHRPSLHALMEDYWRLMPQYQGVDLKDITFKRVLFGFFPTFRNSPLRPGFDRVLQIGDASGIQSPLSFGGFGAMTRHLQRLTAAVAEALEADLLDKDSLALIHAYNPGLSAAWMMQRAMSVRPADRPALNLINRMMSGNFGAMQALGQRVMRPFLQDIIQFQPLLLTMQAQMMKDPLSIPQLILHVGPGPLIDWVRHVAALGAFTALHSAASGLSLREAAKGSSAQYRYRINRLLEAWEFGSGQDYKM